MAVSKVDAANQIENKLPQANIANNVNFRNIVINGSMDISQRATSTQFTGAGYHALDRWQVYISSLGTHTMSQDSSVPTGQGFSKSLKIACDTADSSPAAGDQFYLRTKFEGQNLQYLRYGTSSAQKLTLSFWVKSNKTTTASVQLQDHDNSKMVTKSYTINTADTWEKKTITFNANTSNSFTNDNNLSLDVRWWLDSGSDFTSGTPSGDWEANDNTKRNNNNLGLASSDTNTFFLTGVQLEVGDTASDFEFLPVDINLARCQRYFWRSYADTFYFKPAKNNQRHAKTTFPVTMRSQPTATYFPTNSDLEAGTNSGKAAKDVGATTVSTSNVGGDRNYDTAILTDTSDSNFRVNTKADAEL